MASAIDITRPDLGPDPRVSTGARPSEDAEPRREEGARGRGLFASRITRLIFVCNFIGLLVLLVGALLLSEMRTRLTQAHFQSLTSQGELIANVLIEAATAPGDTGPVIDDLTARDVLRRLVPPRREGQTEPALRARIFSPEGAVIADTDVLHGRVYESSLAPLDTPVEGSIRAVEQAAQGVEHIRITPWRETITVASARAAALRGEVAQGQRLDEAGQRVVMVSIPIQRVHAVLGFLTLESADVERILVAERVALLPFVIAATVVTCLASTLLALFIARPLKRLATAADRVRATGATRLALPDVADRNDEIGDLAQALEKMTAALAERIDLNERFAADVSHEIKNPLASIRSAIDTMRAVKDPEQQAKLFAIVSADVNRLDRLITDIARASRIDAETARSEFSVVDLARLARDVAAAYEHTSRNNVSVRLDGPLPADAIVKGQAGPLGQVLRNLLDNACSFSPQGGVVRVRASSARRRDGAFVRLSVEDEGPGIPPENLETVFTRFYTDRPKGMAFGSNTGLGLSIARQIVEAHGGKIWAENVVGTGETIRGARLIVELPAGVGG
ncbi:MAG: sensor N-terminal transmembrane domain-containing protein [Hyphomonadaceae bacterium]|nr:sensor N-terminal transmembrane domain-containing protein [Hyphomonadaceae bacterium]